MNTPTAPLLRSSEEPPKSKPPSPLSRLPDSVSREDAAAAPKTRIFVAEDDDISRDLICTRLEKWGFEVVAAQNGTEAMTALLKPDAPSLAILDWMMPGMDGLEICRRVRDIDRPLYIILLTARGSEESIVEGLGAGADDYLIKPFEKEELQARIRVGFRTIAVQNARADRSTQAIVAPALPKVVRPPELLRIVDLCVGQRLVGDLRSASGLLLLAADSELTALLLVKLRNFRTLRIIDEYLLVHMAPAMVSVAV